ncbi:MAG: biotin/lipoyl-containing protein [Marinobacter sp.]|uniref:biotin/lipoyl-containing protein n=1 Tax=Marinobacter sp. TaxID=50741 RepID=UPI00396F03FD
MTQVFKLPDLGESIENGTVAEIYVTAGDLVESGQVVMEIETDKSVVEIPIDSGGLVEKVMVAVGDEVSTGTGLLELDTSVTAVAAQAGQAEPAAPRVESDIEESTSAVKVEQVPQSIAVASQTERAYKRVVDVAIPNLGAERMQGVVINIPTGEGELVRKGQALLEIETDKFVLEIPAEFDGQIVEIVTAIEEQVVPGQVALRIATDFCFPDPAVAMPEDEIPGRRHDPVEKSVVIAGPRTRRLARELGVDLGAVAQRQGRERVENVDVTAYARAVIEGGTGTPVSASNASDNHGWLQAEIDMTKLSAWLEQRFPHQDHSPWRTTALVVKGLAMALVPLDGSDPLVEVRMPQAQRMTSVVIAQPCQQSLGLIAQRLSLAPVESEWVPGRSGAVTLVDLGATGLQCMHIPVGCDQLVNVVVGASRREHQSVEDATKVRLMMPISMSFDTRQLSVEQGMACLQRLKGLLEDPIAFAFGD